MEDAEVLPLLLQDVADAPSMEREVREEAVRSSFCCCEGEAGSSRLGSVQADAKEGCDVAGAEMESVAHCLRAEDREEREVSPAALLISPAVGAEETALLPWLLFLPLLSSFSSPLRFFSVSEAEAKAKVGLS
jgi:hypothetical protein